MLTDSHIHFIPKELSEHTTFYKGVWTDKDKLYEFLDTNEVDRALLVYPSTDAHLKLGGLEQVSRIYNWELEKVLREDPRIIAACLIDPENLSDISSRLSELKSRGFRAINLASSYNGRFLVEELFPLFEAAEKQAMPIFVHSQTINPIGYDRVEDPLLMPVLEYTMDISVFLSLLMMQGVLDKFGVRFILASLGGAVPFLKDRFDRVYTMLRRRGIVKDLGRLPSQILKDVYVDTSGASAGNIRLALELFGPDRLLWGSDYPVNPDLESNLKMLDEFGSQVKEKITYKNLTGLFA